MTPVLSWRRFLIAVGWIVALAGGVGILSDRLVIGWTDAGALLRVEKTLIGQVQEIDSSLSNTARVLALHEDVRRGLLEETLAERRLFGVVRSTVEQQAEPGLSVTIYGTDGVPRAWNGRPGEVSLSTGFIEGAGFADVAAAGIRLVHIESVRDMSADPSGETERLGVVVVERVLAPSTTVMAPGPGFRFPTAIGPAVIETSLESGLPEGEGFHSFDVPDAGGRLLLRASINVADINGTRLRWRARSVALVFALIGLVVLAAGARVLLERGGNADSGQNLRLAAAATVVAGICFWLAARPGLYGISALSADVYQSVLWPRIIRTPVDLIIAATFFAAVVALGVVAVNRWRLGHRPARLAADRMIALASRHGGRMCLIGLLLSVQQAVLRDTVDGAAVDLLHTALQPLDSARFLLQVALVLWSAATMWTVGALIGGAYSRLPVGFRHKYAPIITLTWLIPLVVVVGGGWGSFWPSLLMTCMGLALGLRWRRIATWFRHTDPLARMAAILAAVLVPTLPLYLTLGELSQEARRSLIEKDYAVQISDHTEVLREQLLARTQVQVDTIADLSDIAVPSLGETEGELDTDRAFSIWRRTALAESRSSSAVELYGPDGSLNSRFALNLPDYGVVASRLAGSGCQWGEVFGHVAPFGSKERRLLHAERGLCQRTGDGALSPVGTVVVHVAQLDYESLPFISARSPYTELFQGVDRAPVAGEPGHTVELVIYGWGLQPTFMSGRSAWGINEDLFDRIYATRSGFWTRLNKDSTSYDVLVTNDRSGIYALGYPIHTGFDHLLHLSEIAILIIVAFALILACALVVGLLIPSLRRIPAARKVRARFPLKLQLWFVGVATVPVAVVALLIQGYFADQLRADVEAGAARTASVARSFIEESVVLQRPEGQEVSAFTDDLLIRISQVVGQGVNIFDGPRLVSTSERDLYASGLLPTRTPDVVYRAIALDQLPSFVGEDTIGSRRYQLAAAPVRAGGREVILTVPLVSRQQEIEGQIDELSRRVWGFALFFVVAVGCIGWVIARSIANPVRRLTRGTSRVARGEFRESMLSGRAELLHRRVMDRSADELEILESDFNKMAGELDAQRRQLERTHRLEAWTEMARQVAHEIKNPLTPVQLNAEHLLRVHKDRGSPLSPVLQGCVEAILRQVRILRQIASEFSNYSSSPVADQVSTSLMDLVKEVIEPYRAGLEGRVEIIIASPQDLSELSLDRVLMRRAVTNIVENALHAMPGRGSLFVSVLRQGLELELVIADTGVGLEPDVLSRIFEPYFSTKVSGTGLGMAIAKRNVELNGGKITVTSQRGKGTVVTISLPA